MRKRIYHFPNGRIEVLSDGLCLEFPAWRHHIHVERTRAYVARALLELRRHNRGEAPIRKADPSACRRDAKKRIAGPSTSAQWRRWNLDYTKRVLADGLDHPMARSLLSAWSPRIQRALLARYAAGAPAAAA